MIKTVIVVGVAVTRESYSKGSMRPAGTPARRVLKPVGT
jgi:hypothetical protein